MLLSAARQQSDAVFMDLLTFQDLEALKSKKQAAAAAAAAHPGSAGPVAPAPAARPLPPSAAGKRYLILTYASEFDRVHYPLPLAQEEGPDAPRLLAVISGLRQEVARLQAAKRRGGGGGGYMAAQCDGAGSRGAGWRLGGEDDDVGGGSDEAGVLDARRGSGGLASSSTLAALAQRLEAVRAGPAGRGREQLRRPGVCGANPALIGFAVRYKARNVPAQVP
jgi:hypothetical protein